MAPIGTTWSMNRDLGNSGCGLAAAIVGLPLEYRHGVSPVAPPGSFAEALLARAARVGADPADDEDTRSSKGLLVLISLLILPLSALWGLLYLAFGSPLGYVPFIYFAILAGAIAVFSRNGDFSMLLRVNQLDILLATTLSMIPLGGFVDAGGIGLWGVLAPLGALVFSDVRSAVRWFVAWLLLFLGCGVAGVIL